MRHAELSGPLIIPTVPSLGATIGGGGCPDESEPGVRSNCQVCECVYGSVKSAVGGREGGCEEMEMGDKDRGEVIHCGQEKQNSQTSECHPHTGVCVCVCVCVCRVAE